MCRGMVADWSEVGRINRSVLFEERRGLAGRCISLRAAPLEGHGGMLGAEWMSGARRGAWLVSGTPCSSEIPNPRT